MKKLILPIVALLLFGFTSDVDQLTDAERKMVIDYLTTSRDHLKSVVKGLSEEQLNFKAEEEAWSIAECVEHVTIAENAFEGLIKKAVAAGPNPALKDSLKFKDEELMGLITNRSQKVKTAEPFEPNGKFGSYEATLKAFMDKREEHIAYVKTAEDDLRNRFSNDLPFGTVDGLQVLIFIAGHTERHISQMEEVKAHKLFPKK